MKSLCISDLAVTKRAQLRFLSENLAEAPFDLAETSLGMAGLLGGVHLP